MYRGLYLFIYPVYLGLQRTKLLQEWMVPSRPPWVPRSMGEGSMPPLAVSG